MNKFFLDTEFLENGKTIDLISIGIVTDEREYYAVSNEFDFEAAKNDAWIYENVLMPLFMDDNNFEEDGITFENLLTFSKDRNTIKQEILEFVGEHPVFYGYYCDYDWIAFCQLFGKMIDLPKGFPMYMIDLKQIVDYFRLHKDWLRYEVPTRIEHNALIDARWNMRLYEKLKEFEQTKIFTI